MARGARLEHRRAEWAIGRRLRGGSHLELFAVLAQDQPEGDVLERRGERREAGAPADESAFFFFFLGAALFGDLGYEPFGRGATGSSANGSASAPSCVRRRVMGPVRPLRRSHTAMISLPNSCA